MSAWLCRVAVAFALAPWLVFASAMPQEHLHEADADHPQSLVHRHVEAHTFDSHDHHGSEFDHNEERVVWLSNVSLAPTAYHDDVSWAVIGRSLEQIRDSARWVATATYNAAPPHGPPRPSRSPRAPPSRLPPDLT